MIPVFIFTYETDGPLALLAASSAKAAGYEEVFLVEDAAAPLSAANREAAACEELNLITSKFKRNGNLNGVESIRGQLQIMAEVLENTNSSHGLKLDSDTMVTRRTMVETFAETGVSLAGMRDLNGKGKVLIGACYVISIDFALKALNFLDRWGGFPGIDRNQCPEDYSIGTFGMLACPQSCNILNFKKDGGFGAGWGHGQNPSLMPRYVEAYEYVNFGNHTDTEGRRVSQTTMLMAMMAFAKELKLP